MPSKIFHFYNDSGHGWAKISLTEIKRLGIQEKISSYSYIRGRHAYLEEDCDLALIHEAMRDEGLEMNFRDHHSNRSSKIRSYLPFNTACIDWDICEVSQ